MANAEATERILTALETVDGLDILPNTVLANLCALVRSLISDAVIGDRGLLLETLKTATLYLPTLSNVPDPRETGSQQVLKPLPTSEALEDPTVTDAELGGGTPQKV